MRRLLAALLLCFAVASANAATFTGGLGPGPGGGGGGGSGVSIVPGTDVRASTPYHANVNSQFTTQSMFSGIGAGADYPLGSDAFNGSIGWGPNAFAHLIAIGAEDTAFGSLAGFNITTGINDSMFGLSSCRADELMAFSTCIGNDSGRDLRTSGTHTGLTAVGQGSAGSGLADDYQTVYGTHAMQGSSSALLLGPGAVTVADVYTVVIAASGSTPVEVTGLPVTATYTVQGGDTLGDVAIGIKLAVSAALAANPVPYVGHASGIIAQPAVFLANGKYATRLEFNGTSTSGMALTITFTCAGTCTPTRSVAGGTVSNNNAIFGGEAAAAPGATSITHTSVVGRSAVHDAENISGIAGVGDFIGHDCGTCTDSNFVGTDAGHHQRSGANNVYDGPHTGSTVCVSGSGNILVGANLDCLTSSSSNEINVGGLWFGNNTSTAVPVASACGTNPVVESHSNGAFGTVTMGTGSPTGCVITFASAYNTWVHCRVTSQSQLASFAYSYTTAAITTVQTATSSNKIDYSCDGY